MQLGKSATRSIPPSCQRQSAEETHRGKVALTKASFVAGHPFSFGSWCRKIDCPPPCAQLPTKLPALHNDILSCAMVTSGLTFCPYRPG